MNSRSRSAAYSVANANSHECGLEIYLTTWYEDVLSSSQTGTQWEPVIADNTAILMKEACSRLFQNTEVLTYAIDTLEKYLRMQLSKGEPDVEDIPFTAICAMFLCSKYAGGRPRLKLKAVEAYLNRTFNKSYSPKEIKDEEFKIFRTIGHCIPLHNPLDNLYVILENFVKTKNPKLKTILQELCDALMKLFYVSRNSIFEQMRKIYRHNGCGSGVFTECVAKPLYFIFGILLCAIKMTESGEFSDLKKVGTDLGGLIALDGDHLQILSDVILKIAKDM